MEHYEYKTFDSADGKHRVRVVYDPDPSVANPRQEDYALAGVIYAEHRRYHLGDRDYSGELFGVAAEIDDFVREVEDYTDNLVTAILKHLKRQYGATVVLPLYLYDHSGISISAGENLLAGGGINTRTHNVFDPGGWDTSFVGFMFDTRDKRDALGIEDVEGALRSELEEYDMYLRGEVFGLIEEEPVEVREIHTRLDGTTSETTYTTWEEADSCWGYIGSEYVTSEAKQLVS